MIEFVFESAEIKIIQIVLAHLFLIFMIVFVMKKRRESKKMSDFKDVLFTHISPVVLHYFENGRFTDKTFWFILLGLVEKDFYTIYKDEYNGYMLKWNKEDMFELSNYDLEEFEEEIVKFLNPFLLENSKERKEIPIRKLKGKFQMSMRFSKVIPEAFAKLKNRISEEYGLLEKRKNIQFISITILCYYILMFPSVQIENLLLCASYIMFGIMIGLFLNHNKISWIKIIVVWIVYYLFAFFLYPLLPSIFVFSKGMITLLTLFHPMLLLTICFIGTTNFTNPKQQELFRYLNSMKAKIREIFCNNEITVEEMENYYIKALSLNVSLFDVHQKNMTEEKKDFVGKMKEIEKTLLGISKLFYQK
ncbi:MAG: DUF2207 domain-containing protein [Bacilli bacterium]|nr:DUF2207 domain-containing protein [Bacilli bacterium]